MLEGGCGDYVRGLHEGIGEGGMWTVGCENCGGWCENCVQGVCVRTVCRVWCECDRQYFCASLASVMVQVCTQDHMYPMQCVHVSSDDFLDYNNKS